LFVEEVQAKIEPLSAAQQKIKLNLW